MKITLLGVLGVVLVGATLLYFAKQIHEDHEKKTRSGYPAPSPNPPDGPPRKLDSL